VTKLAIGAATPSRTDLAGLAASNSVFGFGVDAPPTL